MCLMVETNHQRLVSLVLFLIPHADSSAKIPAHFKEIFAPRSATQGKNQGKKSLPTEDKPLKASSTHIYFKQFTEKVKILPYLKLTITSGRVIVLLFGFGSPSIAYCTLCHGTSRRLRTTQIMWFNQLQHSVFFVASLKAVLMCSWQITFWQCWYF